MDILKINTDTPLPIRNSLKDFLKEFHALQLLNWERKRGANGPFEWVELKYHLNSQLCQIQFVKIKHCLGKSETLNAEMWIHGKIQMASSSPKSPSLWKYTTQISCCMVYNWLTPGWCPPLRWGYALWGCSQPMTECTEVPRQGPFWKDVRIRLLAAFTWRLPSGLAKPLFELCCSSRFFLPQSPFLPSLLPQASHMHYDLKALPMFSCFLSQEIFHFKSHFAICSLQTEANTAFLVRQMLSTPLCVKFFPPCTRAL